MCHQLSLITIFWLFPLLPTSIQSLCYGLSLAIDKLKVLEPTYKWRQHDWLHLWILSVDTHHLYVSSILLSSAIAKNHQTLCPFNSSVVVVSHVSMWAWYVKQDPQDGLSLFATASWCPPHPLTSHQILPNP